MTERSQQVLELQALDAEIGRLTRQIRQAESQMGDQLKSRAAELAIRQAEHAYQEKQRRQRELEMDLASIEARLKATGQKLYSGKGSPRELQALQHEVDLDKKRQGELEDQALAAMDATQVAHRELERIRAATSRVLGAAAAANEQLSMQRDYLQADLARRTAAREQAVRAIDAGSLALYERVRQRQPDGTAVAEVTQGRCEGCGTTLPSAEVQRVGRSEALSQCSICGRILHVTHG